MLIVIFLVSLPLSSAFAKDCTQEVSDLITRMYNYEKTSEGLKATSAIKQLSVAAGKAHGPTQSLYLAQFTLATSQETGFHQGKSPKPDWWNNVTSEYEATVTVDTENCDLVNLAVNKLSSIQDKSI
jgi:hypothetical protein